MSWDLANNSSCSPLAQTPTPLRTPSSAHFEHSSLRTPQIEPGGAADTPQSNGGKHSPYVPASALWSTPTSSAAPTVPTLGQESHALPYDISVKIAAHVHHLSSNPSSKLPPVDPSRRLSSSGPHPRLRESTGHIGKGGKGIQQDRSSISIQTPPSTCTSHRRSFSSIAESNPSTNMADSSRLSAGKTALMGPPATPSRVMQASPHLFPSLQFSPDLFQPPLAGPATAPAYPQQRLFWDSTPILNVDASTPRQDQDLFGLDPNQLVSSFAQSPAINHNFPNPTLPNETPYDLPPQKLSSMSGPRPPYVEGTPNAFPAPFTTSPRVPPQRTEDPSLFLSSPARRFGGADQSASSYNKILRERQPYHHQIEESRREEEERARKTKTRRDSTHLPRAVPSRRTSSPANAVRPGLTRSLTHSGIGGHSSRPRPQSQVSFAESLPGHGLGSHSGAGRSSPFKPIGTKPPPTMLSRRASTRQRTSLTFAIDGAGRAKTVVTTIPEPTTSFMDLDDESSPSESDSIDETDFLVRSQHNSFLSSEDDNHLSFAQHHKKHFPSHSKNSSSSSTLASSTSAQQSSRTSSNNSGVKSRPLRPASMYVRRPLSHWESHEEDQQQHNARAEEDDFDAMDEDGSNSTALDGDSNSAGKGDAQVALRDMMRDRSKPGSATTAGTITTTGGSSTHSTTTFTHFHSSPPVRQNTFGTTYNNNINISPTTITDPDAATPSTDRESFASGSSSSTRCVCNSSTPDGQFMIQCESCSKWLHVNCVGIDARHIPPVYICVYCAQTPMRHGRIRAGDPTALAQAQGGRPPAAMSASSAQSPLAHKSSGHSGLPAGGRRR